MKTFLWILIFIFLFSPSWLYIFGFLVLLCIGGALYILYEIWKFQTPPKVKKVKKPVEIDDEMTTRNIEIIKARMNMKFHKAQIEQNKKSETKK